jgi:hypothetical protein
MPPTLTLERAAVGGGGEVKPSGCRRVVSAGDASACEWLLIEGDTIVSSHGKCHERHKLRCYKPSSSSTGLLRIDLRPNAGPTLAYSPPLWHIRHVISYSPLRRSARDRQARQIQQVRLVRCACAPVHTSCARTLVSRTIERSRRA